MDRPKLWSRVGSWFRPSSRAGGSADPLASGEDRSADAYDSDSGVEDAATKLSKMRVVRSTANLERLEEEYARVVKLIESVQRHLEEQGSRSAHIASSLERLADSLAHIPEASKTQLELLSAMSRQMGEDGASNKRIEEALSQLPQLADSQRETMVSIGRQLDASRTTTERVSSTLEGFQQEVTQLGNTTSETVRALEKMRWDATARDERLATVLGEQTTRLTAFAAAAIALAVVAAAAGVAALFL
jgi:archaellum component FlaC